MGIVGGGGRSGSIFPWEGNGPPCKIPLFLPHMAATSIECADVYWWDKFTPTCFPANVQPPQKLKSIAEKEAHISGDMPVNTNRSHYFTDISVKLRLSLPSEPLPICRNPPKPWSLQQKEPLLPKIVSLLHMYHNKLPVHFKE